MKKQNTKERYSVCAAIKLIWQVMTIKQKFLCLPLFFGLLARPFAMLMPVQCIAAVIAKLENEVVQIFGIVLPDDWNIAVVAAFSFSLIFVFWVLGSTAYYCLWTMSGKITNQINEHALEWTLSPRKNMNLKMTKGELCYLIKSSTDTIQNFIETLFIDIIPPLASFVLSLIYIGLIDWVVMLMVLAVSAVVLVCAYGRVLVERKFIVNEETYRGKINNLFLNSVTNLPFISLFKCFVYEKKSLDVHNQGYYKNLKKRAYSGWTYWFVVMIIEYVSMASAVIITNAHAVSGVFSISAAVLLMGYILNVYDPIENLGFNISFLQQAAIKICRVRMVKPTSDDLITKPIVRQEIKEINKIEMKNISLQFGLFKLEDVNFTFKRGEMIALAGPSGAGKTSVIQSLLGLKEYSKGQILINGEQEVKSLFFDDDKVSYALQEMQMFDKSLEENLLYPNLVIDAQAEKVIKALSIDKILENNNGKTEGLEQTLSGGEKKRINIARAVIKPAELYILDEPTNELDKKNVEEVLKILKQLKKKSIVIVISHDARLTEICDKVYYF